jgi:hypothetical protein
MIISTSTTGRNEQQQTTCAPAKPSALGEDRFYLKHMPLLLSPSIVITTVFSLTCQQRQPRGFPAPRMVAVYYSAAASSTQSRIQKHSTCSGQAKLRMTATGP